MNFVIVPVCGTMYRVDDIVPIKDTVNDSQSKSLGAFLDRLFFSGHRILTVFIICVRLQFGEIAKANCDSTLICRDIRYGFAIICWLQIMLNS